MATWEQKFVRFMAERWVFQGSDPHDFTPRIFLLGMGEDFLSPQLQKHKHHGALYSGYLGGKLVGYMRVPPGTVILEGIMRSLMFTRVDTVIGLGTCGALQPEIELGDVIIAESAKTGDCVAPYYGFEQGSMAPADESLTDSLGTFLRRSGVPVHTGPIVTTGAVFRETEDLIQEWNAAGFLGVELETSSLYALGRHEGIKTVVAHLVTDSPIREEMSMSIMGGPKRQAFVQGIIDFVGSSGIV